MTIRRTLVTILLTMLAATTVACSSGRAVVKQVVQQGIETTSTGPHNVVPANTAQQAVDAVNAAQQAEQQQVQGASAAAQQAEQGQ